MKEVSKSKKKHHFVCIELLKKFSEKEIERLIFFVESLYFNSDLYIVKLLEVLKKQVLDEPYFNNALQRMVYEHVFDKKIAITGLNVSQKQQLNHKLSALLRLVERFLVVEGLEEHQAYYNDILLQKILMKKQFKLFNRYVKRNKKQLKTQSKKDIQYYEHLQKIEKKVLEYLYLNGQLNIKDNLPKLNYNLDMTYIIDKFSLHITLLHLEEVTLKKYDASSIEAMEKLINLPQYAVHPLICIYLAIIDFTKAPNEASYHQLLLLLDIHTSAISKENLNGFYVLATNFCIRQIQTGEFDYRQLFDLYKIMYEKDLLIENNFISINKLKTVVAVGCRVGEFEWIMGIVEKYQPFVEKVVRKSVYHFNLGVVAFYQKDYEKALHHFIRVESVNFNYDLNCRVIMMKTHYEVDREYDERTQQIYRSAEKYFNENKQLTPKKKKAYKNFIRTLINLYRIRHRATRMRLEDLKAKLELQEVNSDNLSSIANYI